MILVKMKEMLRSKYYIRIYDKKIHEQLMTLRHGSMQVIKYMNTFEELIAVTHYTN